MHQNKEKINTLLEKGIIEKLQYHWKTILWDLEKKDPGLAGRLKPPVITISGMKNCLGQWHGANHEIRMSRNLILNARWDSICEVFTHEVAHQLASTIPQSLFETSHGPTFRACCRIIGANPEASGTFQTLEDRIWKNKNDENDKIMIKVKKLMSLAESGNNYEAESAAAKAGELITRYNIDIIEEDRERGFESIIITEPALKVSQAESMTVGILSRYYFVRPIWIHVYIPEKRKIGKALEISGTPTNIKIADYVFHYVLQYAESNWYRYKKEHPECRSRSGFMTGVVSGFGEKLKKQQEATISARQRETAPGKNLVVLDDKKLTEYFNNRYPDIITTSKRYQSRSRDAYDSGKQKGQSLTISKTITSSGGNGGRLIEH